MDSAQRSVRLAERRYHNPSSQVRLTCRVCFSALMLQPQRLRHVDGFWVMQCPECGGSFPVRADDATRAG